MARLKINRALTSERKFLGDISLVYLHQIIQILLAIISVPIALSYFGAENYGLISIIWTFITYLSLVNFGLPIAARVFLAANPRVDDRKKIFSIIFLMLTFLAMCCLILIVAFPKNLVFIVGTIPVYLQDIASNTIFVTFLIYLFSVPFLIYLEGFAGIGMIGRVKVYEICNIILGFLCLLAIVRFDLSIYHLFLYRGCTNLFISIVATVDLFRKLKVGNREMDVKLTETSHKRFQIKWNEIVKTGFFQLMTGVSAILVWHTDNLIVSHFFGLSDVTRYSLTFKLISTAFIVFTAINTVVSPIYGRLFGNNEYSKIREQYKKVLIFVPLIGGLVWLGALNFSAELIGLWAGEQGNAGFWVVFILGAYGFCLAFVHSHMALVSAINIMRFVPILGFIEAGLNLVLSILFAKFLGLAGVALGTLLGGLFSMFVLPILIWKESEVPFLFNWKYSIFQVTVIILPFIGLSCLLRFLNFGELMQFGIGALLVLSYMIVGICLLPKTEFSWVKNLLKKRL